MFNNLHSLELTSEDLKLIEAALHTQKKILSVQSQAGGSGAHLKLNELKRLIARVNRSVDMEQSAPAPAMSFTSYLVDAVLGPRVEANQPR